MSSAAHTLDASAEAFLACGLPNSAEFCQELSKSCRQAAETLGHQRADELYAHWASELAERASRKLAAFNLEKRG